jgi:hypothetical protein
VRRVDEKEGEQRHQRDAAEYGTQRALHELTIHPPAAVYAAAPDGDSAFALIDGGAATPPVEPDRA